MYEIPQNYIQFEDGAKINRAKQGLRLVKADGNSVPVHRVSVYDGVRAIAYDDQDVVLQEGTLT